MYLGDERVETLAAFLAGYETGRADAGETGMHDDNALLLSEFDVRLAEKTGRHGRLGSLRWPQLIARIDSGPSNVRTFFEQFEEFLESTGRSFAGVPEWTPVGWEPDPSSIKER